MDLFFSKLLPVFVYPVGIVCVLLTLALILRRKTAWMIGLTVAALVILTLAGNRWIAFSLVRSLERQYPPIDLPVQADAIVVLGGATEAISFPRQIPEVNGAGDRVIYAAYLYREGAAPLVLVSGGRIDWYGPAESSQAQEMAALLVFMGVPQGQIILEENARNTAENAQFSAELLRQMGAKRILLVTSAMHMPRAVPLFESLGMDVIPSPADYIVSDVEWESLVHAGPAAQIINFLPSAGSLNLTTNALKEYLGIWVNYLSRLFS